MPRRAVLPLLLTLLMLVPLVVAQDSPIEPPFPTDRATETATPTASETATASSTPSASATETNTLIPSETDTLTPEPEVTETVTPSETVLSSESATFTASSTATPSETATSTAESTDFAEVTETLAFDSLVEVATSTPTITGTRTMTPTPVVEWCRAFDFTLPNPDQPPIPNATQGWRIPTIPDRGLYTENVGFVTNLNQEGGGNNITVHIRTDFTTTTTLTSLRAEYDVDSLADREIYALADSYTFFQMPGENGNGQVVTWVGNRAVSYVAVQLVADRVPVGFTPDLTTSGTITKMTLTGTGTNPFTSSNCAVPATPTPTPSRTATRTPDLTNCIVISRYVSNLTEGGVSIVYNARLLRSPAAGETVVITPLNSRPDQVSISPLSRQLNNTNWDTGRNFTITAVNDTVPEVDETGTITHNASSNVGGSVLNGIVACATMVVNIYDNDGATPTYTRTPTRTPTVTATPTPTIPICLPRFSESDSQQRTDETITVTIGTGAGDGSPRANLFFQIYSEPAEQIVRSNPQTIDDFQPGLTQLITQTSYPPQSFPITIVGRYRIRENGITDKYWYRVQYTLPSQTTVNVGWMTDFQIDFILANSLDVSCPSNLMALPEQDRDGTLVHTLLYGTGRTPSPSEMLLAPILGNPAVDSLNINNDRILRIRNYATNPTALGGGTYIFGRRYDTAVDYKVGWIAVGSGTAITASELSAIQATLGSAGDRTSFYGGPFQTAVSNSTLPGWTTTQSLPAFTYYPISATAACASRAIYGLGEPYNSDIYPEPYHHIGVDFFAPYDSPVFSVANGGLVVGIGIGETQSDGSIVGIDGASTWGSAGIEPGQTGYSVIVRHGHLYVLYGHLRRLDERTFMGALVNAGSRLGTIGNYVTPHVHIEVRNFGTNFDDLSVFQPSPRRQFGFLAFDSIASSSHPVNLYDVAQLYRQPAVIARTNDNLLTGTVSGLGVNLTDGDQINIAGGTSTSNCTNVEYTLNYTLPQVVDPVLNDDIRGFVLYEATLTPPLPPSTFPPAP